MNTTLSQTLTVRGISPTPQRLAVYANLVRRRDHPSVDAVFRDVRKAMPTLSKTTVYSTMQLLAEKGLIGCVHLEDGETRYDGIADFHAHFRCTRCGKVCDVMLDAPHRRPFAKLPKGFTADTEELTYYGICPNCRNEKDKKGK